MTDSREQILGSVRKALGRGPLTADQSEALWVAMAAPRKRVVPERGLSHGEERIERFIAEAERVNATVTRIASLNDVPEAVRDYLAAGNLPAVLKVAPDPDLATIPWSDVPTLEISHGRGEDGDLVSVTSAFAGLSETGTVMLTSGPDSPTTLNFLPDVHIVVLQADRIEGAYEDAWTRFRARNSGGEVVMPRVVNWITGPSRTADIEQTLLLGAHGPRRLHILVVDGPPA